jgi:hypothetical protein
VEVSFADLLAQVPEASGDEPPGTFRVQAIPSAPKHYIGRNAAGQPCILLGSASDRMQAPVRLAAIEARFGVACRISPAGGQPREEVLTVVTCTAPELQVQDYFLHICETIVRIVGPAPTQGRVVEVVQRLIDLFQRLTRPSSRSVLGLIGELYVIARGSGTFVNGDGRHPFSSGDVLFVPAGASHRFEDFTDDFATWVIFYGPEGGERTR